MTDAKQEALRQALYYHTQSMSTAIEISEKPRQKKPSPQQIVTTAKVFEAFLDPNGKKR